jgi:Calcineurin-like phosphoesterase/Secretion system C-terminal sorting domain
MRLLIPLLFVSLLGGAQVTIVKGPYLQIGTPGSMIIKWQTNLATSTACSYGTNPLSLNLSYNNSTLDTIHEAFLNGLAPHSKYYYSIGGSSLILQGDSTNYFLTSPLPGATGSYRFWITGDCGNNSSNQDSVRNSYLAYNATQHTDGWLLLGDNAYNSGLDNEYNLNFFSHYQNNNMKNMVLWPAPGNHDYGNLLANQNTHQIPYFSIFNLPTYGEAGGVWSGTEAFYSYNYGNVHFVSLDSYGKELNQYRLYDTLGPQITWLKQDLGTNTLPWVVIYFHHPPYTMGSHNSDTEFELDSIRKNVVSILERYNVDFVLSGHSHSYERSKFITGHYGYENSFNPSVHQIDSSSALYNGSPNSCPHIKNNNTKGTIYIVSGSAGSLGGTQSSFPHDAMYYSNTTHGGSLIMDITSNRADFRWLCADGIIRDSFTVFKNVNKVITYSVNVGQSLTLQPSWPGNYIWNNDSTSPTLTFVANNDSVIWVKDQYDCLADTFKIKTFTGINESNTLENIFTVFPNPTAGEFGVQFYLKDPSCVAVNLISVGGTKITLEESKKMNAGEILLHFNSKSFAQGIYFLEVEINAVRTLKKLIISE